MQEEQQSLADSRGPSSASLNTFHKIWIFLLVVSLVLQGITLYFVYNFNTKLLGNYQSIAVPAENIISKIKVQEKIFQNGLADIRSDLYEK